MRRIGECWLPGRPYRDRPGVYGLITGPAGLLCVRQADELQLPGGGVERGEQPIPALHREVLEETGWAIGPPRRVDAFQRYSWIPEYAMWARKVQAIYLARAVARRGAPREPDHRPLWLAPEVAVRQLDVEGDREALRRALRRGMIAPRPSAATRSRRRQSAA